jgi:hypothetical protein
LTELEAEAKELPKGIPKLRLGGTFQTQRCTFSKALAKVFTETCFGVLSASGLLVFVMGVSLILILM